MNELRTRMDQKTEPEALRFGREIGVGDSLFLA